MQPLEPDAIRASRASEPALTNGVWRRALRFFNAILAAALGGVLAVLLVSDWLGGAWSVLTKPIVGAGQVCDPDELEALLALKPVDPDEAPAVFAEEPYVALSDRPGRVDIDLVTRREPGTYAQSIAIRGLYGAANDGDVLVKVGRDGRSINYELPASGACATWNREATADASAAATNHWRFEGLWGGERYCFIISVAPTVDRLSHSDASRTMKCIDTSWNWSWGAMDYPPLP